MRLSIKANFPGKGEIVVGSFDTEKAQEYAGQGESLWHMASGLWATFSYDGESYTNGAYMEADDARQWLISNGFDENALAEAFPEKGQGGRRSIGPRLGFSVPQDVYDRVEVYQTDKGLEWPEACRLVMAAGLKALKVKLPNDNEASN